MRGARGNKSIYEREDGSIKKAYRTYLQHLEDVHPLTYKRYKKQVEDQLGLL